MWFFGLIVVLLIGAVAVVASGRWGAMAPAYDDRPDLTVPARQALTADDLETARFGVGLRGYRMDEVDTLLERVAREVAERDRRIADLERAVSPIIHGPEGAGFTARADYHPTDFEDTGFNQPILVGGNFPTPDPEPAAPPQPEAPAATEAPAQAEPQPEPTAPLAAAADPQTTTAAEAPSATDAPAKPQAQVGTQPQADPHVEQQTQPDAVATTVATPNVLAEPHALTPPAAPPAQPVTEPWFEEVEPTSVLDGQPQSPVPLPPMLQELVHPHEPEESWFEAKEPPPEYPEGTATDPTPAADEQAADDEAGEGEDGQPRGRHSAAPDVSAVQRPN
ncbi:DivIVA domain-containing protein [Streptomyces sp. SID13031]|uniref:DivIVA domain-containing protein n=1 Tax=Streptomyces sp. SID13031 TaxID=2706046 RepID=UPI001EF2E045|nr:DivIVA domain-containing protein [Streptomyces sp. SID13031]